MKRIIITLAFFALIASAVSAQTVLIAKEDTGYKKALLETLVPKLEAEGFTIVTIDHKKDNLAVVDPTDYEAVYVLNSGAQARVRPDIVSWLNSVSANDDNILLHTTKRTVWDEGVAVDAITSASKKSNIEDVSDDVVSRLKALL